ncbi:MAG: permease [Candidatus Nealsonbacteria bacterium RIFOXYB1_FULL_40_15]|uniref:Permease n=2 Tax=Candidatus Nealsoniibacteriota TaxID=1817911 RepID=A0A1G2ETU7_9BACT|nr:MAG: permease [Candidatus Nealsonbacteria bacterium RIFOXYB1_FULL_40_15]OGZ29206.1 MAG: permease [Candidatus Nealsonbacteria bacterium RIFOXYC1_FULL_40_7]OGZ29888.1 MAG: permease [Candidatus Nealsonbacteria bacterium RIFOXYD1_FULL_39_11]
MLGLALSVLGAVLSVSLAGVGSVIGVGKAGRAASGIVSEEPEKFGKLLLLQALPSTQGIYGFIGAFWVILKLGLLSGQIPFISWQTGLAICFACLPIAIGGLASGIFQGMVSVSGMNIVAKRPQESGKGVILAAMVETYAVLGLLATILLIQGINIV